jgi:hypothetical protein
MVIYSHLFTPKNLNGTLPVQLETFEGEEEHDLWIWDNANTATGGDEADEEGADLDLEDRAVVRAV